MRIKLAKTGIHSSGDGWIRFTDGTQICWFTLSILANTGERIITFPKSFVATPVVTISSGFDGGSIKSFAYNNIDIGVSIKVTTRTYTNTIPVNEVFFTYVAIGKWK